MEKFTVVQCHEALGRLPLWTMVEKREAIFRSYQFSDFASAFGWMTKMALVCEKMNHHPEWLNIYNRVDVTLATHEAKGVTQKDIDLAQAMDAAFQG